MPAPSWPCAVHRRCGQRGDPGRRPEHGHGGPAATVLRGLVLDPEALLAHAAQLRLAPAPCLRHRAGGLRPSWNRVCHGGTERADAASHPRRSRRQGHLGRWRARGRAVDDQHRHRGCDGSTRQVVDSLAPARKSCGSPSTTRMPRAPSRWSASGSTCSGTTCLLSATSTTTGIACWPSSPRWPRHSPNSASTPAMSVSARSGTGSSR